jgi:hypothetical protein
MTENLRLSMLPALQWIDCMSHEPSAPLRYVACVSYPRSGHHLTVRVLKHYFRDDFKYCQYYNKTCADCCQTFPCTDATVSMTKNHDMDLNHCLHTGLPKQAGVPYLVLVRNFLEAVVSDFNLFLRQNDDTADAWHTFSQRKLLFYQRFLQKWVLSEDGLEKMLVRYETLTTEPLDAFSRIISFFHPPDAVDPERLQRIIDEAVLEDVKPTGIEIIRKFGVRNRRKLEEFKYYDARYFARLESQLAAELSQLGYPLRFAA